MRSAVKWAPTCSRAATATASRVSESSASAVLSVWARALASPGGTSQPVSPGSTVSRAPPWSLAITGRPMAWASAATRPKASGSVEAETTTSASK